MTSPVSKLPVEILADIFLYCVPDTLKSSPDKVAPLSFSQVSSFWRSTALETPSLWSMLTIGFPSSIAEINDFDNLLDALKPYKTLSDTWLARAGSYVPISIELDYEEVQYGYSSFLAALSWLLSEILVLYVDSLRSLTLKGSTCGVLLYDIDAKLNLKTENSPVCLSLEKVNLIGDEDTTGHWFDRIATVFKYSPKLRQVIFSNPLYWSNIGTIALPYSQLTHLILAIEEISFFDWRQMMSQCTNLVWGAFAFQRPAIFQYARWIQSDIVPIDFPYLTHLHLVCRSKFFGQFVEGLNFPALLEFSLDSRGIDNGSDIGNLLRLMRPVRKFILDIPGTDYTSSDVTPLLKAIPDAEEIYLQIHRMDHKELFKALMPTPTNDMLPHLSLLSIYFSDMQGPPGLSFQSFPQREFVELISSRWDYRTRHSDEGQPRRLEEVILHIWEKGARPDEFKALDRFEREGLKTTVKMIADKVRWKERLDIELKKAGWGEGVRLVNFSND